MDLRIVYWITVTTSIGLVCGLEAARAGTVDRVLES
jgi:hypothetical protein